MDTDVKWGEKKMVKMNKDENIEELLNSDFKKLTRSLTAFKSFTYNLKNSFSLCFWREFFG